MEADDERIAIAFVAPGGSIRQNGSGFFKRGFDGDGGGGVEQGLYVGAVAAVSGHLVLCQALYGGMAAFGNYGQ